MKTFVYKIYDSFGNYLNNLTDVIEEPTFSQEINSAGSEMTLQLARNLDDFGEAVDIAFGNIVKIYVTDKEEKDLLIFQGKIVNYAPYYAETESLKVTLYSLGFELDYIIFKTNESPEQTQDTGSTEIIIGPDSTIAQSFIPDQPTLSSLIIKAKAEISSTTITVAIHADNAGVPLATAIANTTLNKIITSSTVDEYKFIFGTPPTLTVASTYWIVVGAS